jgi:branched-chain amino acid transport system permease protein
MDDLVYYLVQGLCFGAIIALIAVGYSLVYGIVKLINFAHGEFYMVGAYAGFGVYTLLPPGSPALPAMLLILLAAGSAGAGIAGLTEWVAYRPIRNRGRLAALLTAIGVSFLLQNLAGFIKHAQVLQYPTTEGSIGAFCQTPVKISGDDGIFAISLAYPAVAVVLGLGLWLLVLYTRFGRAMRAVSVDRDAAVMMGIDVDSVIRRTFLLGGFLAGLAGALASFTGAIGPIMGFQPGLKAFIAAVLGGIGSIPGAVIGGLALGLIEYLAVWAGVPTEYKDIAAFVLLIVVLVTRPSGLLGRPEREKV